MAAAVAAGAALVVAADAHPAAAANGNLTQILCMDPATGVGVGGAMPAELTTSATIPRWDVAASWSSCPARVFTGADGINMSAGGGSFGPNTYTSLIYRVPAGMELRAGTIYRTHQNPVANGAYLAINQNAGTQPNDVFASPRNMNESGDWYVDLLNGTWSARWRGRGDWPNAPENRVDLLVHARNGWTITAACRANGHDCTFGDLAWYYRIYGGRMSLYDPSDPVVTNLAGTLPTAATLRGTETLEFHASDSGSGVYRALLEIDGAIVSSRGIDSNAGRCRAINAADAYVFATATPCKASVGSGYVEFDTRSVEDGTYRVRVLVEDAGGNRTTALTRQGVEIDNHPAPRNLTPPAWTRAASAPTVGDVVEFGAGEWTPENVTLTYRVQSCVRSDCDERALAGSGRYTVTAADVDRTLTGEVVAVNTAGTAIARTPATSPVLARRDDPVRRDGERRDDSGGRGGDGEERPPGPREQPGGGGGPAPGPGPVPGLRAGGGAPAARFSIVGLVNPVAGPGHVPNGVWASENARGRIAFDVRRGKKRARVSTVRSTMNRREVIRGQLLNSGGRPIVGAKLVTAWQQAGGSRWVAKTGVTTIKDGRFVYVLPKGPSRGVKFIYFAHSDSTSYAESNTVRQHVTTPVTLRVAPRLARNGRTVKFTGQLARVGLPRGGVLVTLEARYPGSKWKQFKVVRTNRTGSFTATYRFTSTSTRTRYSFRARAAKQTAYPFDGGLSPTTAVTVNP